MNITLTPELHELIQRHARRAGMSAPAYMREAIARAAGWDAAMARFEERIAGLERQIAEQGREIERLKGERSRTTNAVRSGGERTASE